MCTGDLLVAQTRVEVFHVSVTIERYSLYADIQNAVEKGRCSGQAWNSGETAEDSQDFNRKWSLAGF